MQLLSLYFTYIGRQCVFPFGYQGKTYNGCTIADAPDNKKWCSVQVDENGNHIGGRGLWGHCSGDCQTDLDGNSGGNSPPTCTPVDCQWAGWRNWGTCSKTCCGTGRGTSQSRRTTNSNCGTRRRVRGIRQQAQCGGKECSPADEEEIEQCNTTPCPSAPVNCQWDNWSSWSPCSASCGLNGSRSRRRRIKQAAQNGGIPCTSNDFETETCGGSQNCPIKDDFSQPKRKFNFE